MLKSPRAMSGPDGLAPSLRRPETRPRGGDNGAFRGRVGDPRPQEGPGPETREAARPPRRAARRGPIRRALPDARPPFQSVTRADEAEEGVPDLGARPGGP